MLIKKHVGQQRSHWWS